MRRSENSRRQVKSVIFGYLLSTERFCLAVVPVDLFPSHPNSVLLGLFGSRKESSADYEGKRPADFG